MALKVRDYDSKPRARSAGGGVGGDDRPTFSQRAGRFDLSEVLEKRRRSKKQLTAELIATYGRVLNDSTQEVAANAIGFSVRTIANWISQGQDPDCDDEMLVLLADVHAHVMTSGNRKVYMDVWREHSLDDPKAAMELAKATIPSLNVPKVQKIDLNATATKPPTGDSLDELSDEEVLAMATLERAKLKRLQGG